MSIKSLFDNKSKAIESASSASADVESKDYVFTINLKDLRDTCKELAALFDKFKKQS